MIRSALRRLRALLLAALCAAPLRAAPPEYPKRLTAAGVANLAQVSPVLYRGAQPTAEGFRSLRSLGVKTVLSARSAHEDAPLLAGLGLFSFRLPMHQWDVKTEDVVKALRVILAPDYQPVFVHCQAGKDRTGLIVGAYEVLAMDRPVDEALASMRSFGGLVFWDQNQTWMDRLRNPAVREGLKKQVGAAPLPALARVP